MVSSALALLDGLGGPEVLVIGVIALLLFGSKRMPELGRGLGRAIREFKRATSGVEENIREVLYEDPARPKLRAPAQRRAHRDPQAHQATSTPASSAATDAASVTPAAPAAPGATELNEIAPPETPDFTQGATDTTPPPSSDEGISTKPPA